MMYLTTLIYGGYLIAMGQMQAADLAMYALYIGIFISPIQILVELVEMLQKVFPDSAAISKSLKPSRKFRIKKVPLI